MKVFKHDLGIEAKDLVTGLSGIVISRTEHITGCNTYGITPKSTEGKVNDTHWFDESRVLKIGDGVVLESHDDGAGLNHPQNHKSHS